MSRCQTLHKYFRVYYICDVRPCKHAKFSLFKFLSYLQLFANPISSFVDGTALKNPLYHPKAGHTFILCIGALHLRDKSGQCGTLRDANINFGSPVTEFDEPCMGQTVSAILMVRSILRGSSNGISHRRSKLQTKLFKIGRIFSCFL